MQGIDFKLNVNVGIRVVDGNTGKYKEYFGHNLGTKQMSLGVFKFLRGDFDRKNTEDVMADFYPHFFVVGYSDNPTSFTDTSLGQYLYYDGSKDDSPPYSVGTDLEKICVGSSGYNESSTTITLSLRFYIASDVLAGTTDDPTVIKEIGLLTPNHQLCARYVMPTPIEKKENDFIDVVWDISITSINENT